MQQQALKKCCRHLAVCIGLHVPYIYNYAFAGAVPAPDLTDGKEVHLPERKVGSHARPSARVASAKTSLPQPEAAQQLQYVSCCMAAACDASGDPAPSCAGLYPS